MSIKLLKSRGSPPWGCTINGSVGIYYTIQPTGNFVVRFFTPNTQTELAKTMVIATNTYVHLSTDSANGVTSAAATDQATLNTLLNEMKADYNTHRADVTYHSAADSTNAVTSADATNEATSITLVNEIKADYNAHRILRTAHLYPEVSHPVGRVDATTMDTARYLANDLKAAYNLHLPGRILYFTLGGIMPGTYDIGFRSLGTISVIAEDVVITPGVPVEVSFAGLLYPGDNNNSDNINSADTGIENQVGALMPVGACSGYAGDWLMPDPTTFGDWTAIPTARRKTY